MAEGRHRSQGTGPRPPSPCGLASHLRAPKLPGAARSPIHGDRLRSSHAPALRLEHSGYLPGPVPARRAWLFEAEVFGLGPPEPPVIP
jgi:hypothetical protein